MKQIIFTLILVLGFGLSVLAQNEKPLCPTIEVVGGGVVTPGEPMNFSVKISDEAKTPDLEYEWTVSQGTIVRGQATTSIVVETTGLSGQNITAQVKVKGLGENCANAASEVGSVAQKPSGDPLDKFGKLSNDEVKARIDALFITLGNEPNSQGAIINYGTDE